VAEQCPWLVWSGLATTWQKQKIKKKIKKIKNKKFI
jgi:hypothetical protein